MASTTSSITTSWTPPDAITGLSATVIEELSHIQLDWDVSTLADVDFERYSVERRKVGESSFTIIRSITDKNDNSYLDALTGQGVEYEYRVLQYKEVPGDAPLASPEGDVVTAALESDIWFVIGNANPNDTAHAFELPVYQETHTRPIQQEVFEPIVSSRKKVARGNVLGYEGTLSLVWDTSERADAKDQLQFLAENAGPHILKSPFGDVWQVEFDSPNYRYQLVGHLAVDIGWVEVV